MCRVAWVRSHTTPNPASRQGLKDHLGNVRVAITDYKLPINPDPTIQPRGVMPFAVDERAVNDYYPYGMIVKERSWTSENYRYGYNGKENDNEVKGTGNSIDYGARIYDPRVARWLSLDPLMKKYPGQTPYSYVKNNPNIYVDEGGRDAELVIDHKNKTITVKAAIDIPSGGSETLESAEGAIKFWQDQNGKFTYMPEGTIDLKDGYRINFDIKVIAYKEFDKNQNLIKNIDNQEFNAPKNQWAIVSDEEVQSVKKGAGGITQTNTTRMSDLYGGNILANAHELGHLIGMLHSDYPGNVASKEVQNLGERIWIPQINSILGAGGIGIEKTLQKRDKKENSKYEPGVGKVKTTHINSENKSNNFSNGKIVKEQKKENNSSEQSKKE